MNAGEGCRAVAAPCRAIARSATAGAAKAGLILSPNELPASARGFGAVALKFARQFANKSGRLGKPRKSSRSTQVSRSSFR